MISLEPMTAEEFDAAQRRLWQAYRASWTRSGASEAEAAAKETAVRESILPGGALRAGHHPLNIVVDNAAVGFVWLAERTPGDWYIYDFVIAADHRRKGIGAAALRAAEEIARSRGGLKLEFNVFSFNTAMQELAGEAGYQVVTATVGKAL